jgi:rhodanese-related sulfurtransferase
MDASITSQQLQKALHSPAPPLVIDVRRAADFAAADRLIAGALYRDPEHVGEWAGALPRASSVVVHCKAGHEVSQAAARALRDLGIAAAHLEGGIAGWIASEGATIAKPAGARTRWVTRERPKIDRIACPWLISRFVDRNAEFLYVAPAEVRRVAAERDAIPYDVPDVAFTHVGETCSFDTFVKSYRLESDPALAQLATIVRGADTGNLGLSPQSPGLVALSLGLSRLYRDDHEMLGHGMTMYDALYLWCKEGQSETHTWNPTAYR